MTQGQQDHIHVGLAEYPVDEEMDAPVLFRMYCGEVLELEDSRGTPDPREGTCPECLAELERRDERQRRRAEPALAA